MWKDDYGHWRTSGDSNADWAQCIAVRDEELANGTGCAESALMAMALLAKKISKDVANISAHTKIQAYVFEEDYRAAIFDIVFAKLPLYNPVTGPFVTMIYNDMQQKISQFKLAPYSGGEGAPSYYQAVNMPINSMSIEAMRYNAAQKNGSDTDFTFELIDEKTNIEQEYIEKEEAESINIVRRRYPFKNGSQDALFNATAVAKLLGGFSAMPEVIQTELKKIWSTTPVNTDMNPNTDAETNGFFGFGEEPSMFDAEPAFI